MLLLPRHLESNFAAGNRYLVCTHRRVWLAPTPPICLGDIPGERILAATDLVRLWACWLGLTLPRRTLTDDDVLTVARIDSETLERWQNASVVRRSDQGEWSPAAAFAIATAAALLRAGLPVRAAWEAARFIQGEEVWR